ncbi:LytR/AlgR family response regulator transcription factor [Flavilitoribacter nigricans]|uniref:DNA-binding response regulator n=1 Tax=Flavilitoribacter nigricans (strain ATCC 23147 / DSM 23189 / NBRC 102662 / NCIMB 1420 / SS-2) TaxID=1122177 RepID=A0A2D0MY27_FLAN2|nr:LytTR family DNA-binding domain-containing protein [Flavilitoribacter nigricans]PHN01038.1 DNA-binding response regulator [Flavilitoribacter nigricans DSM 23189 = NBRC 102662]
MKRIVIIEDEHFAAEHLEEMIRQVRPDADILVKLPTVRESVDWLKSHGEFDLIFTDIQLADGTCFEIFSEVVVRVPIIFTTAYDQYALRAFKVNSVDYLLKPIDKPALRMAFAKLEQLQPQAESPPAFSPGQIQQLLRSMQPEYKQRFAVKIGDHLKLIPTEEVLYFLSQHKLTYLFTESGKKYPVQYTLAELEELLDPRQFFRINRQMLLRDRAIEDVVSISNSRLKVKIPFAAKAVIVSRERCPDFRTWLDG